MSYITVEHVKKDFKIHHSEPGIRGAVSSLLHPSYTVKRAVDDISFTIEAGEIIGYIGPNGAGKSTTIKMLTGILTPTEGIITVNGLIPYKDRKKNAKQIGVVFGQRSQLYWDLPIADTFRLYQKMYDVEAGTFRKNLDYYVELLDMKDFIHQPVRQLSLGQKMKANIAIAMLHDPGVLYLDEPTIGLDVMSKRKLRECLKKVNEERQTTIILTTHDMQDIESVSSRLILIDKGQKLFDGTLPAFKESHIRGISLKLEFDTAPDQPPISGYTLKSSDAGSWILRADERISAKDALIQLIETYNPKNIFVQETNIEDIVNDIFQK